MLKNSPGYQLLVNQSMAELQLKTQAHTGVFQIGQCKWSVDQDAGTIVFTAPNGLTAVSPVQIVGTYCTLEKTWMWGWDHPSVVPELQQHAIATKAYGMKLRYPSLTTRNLRCSENDCWELTAIACKINQAQGGYRGPADSTRIFMTFGNVTIQSAKPKTNIE